MSKRRREFPSTPGGSAVYENDDDDDDDDDHSESESESEEDSDEEEDSGDDEEEEGEKQQRRPKKPVGKKQNAKRKKAAPKAKASKAKASKAKASKAKASKAKASKAKASNELNRPKRTLAFRSPTGEQLDSRPSRRRRLQPPSATNNRKGGSGNVGINALGGSGGVAIAGSNRSQATAMIAKQKRDEEYLAVYRGKLNSTQLAALNEERNLQRLVISSAVYDSLARKVGGGAKMRPPTEGILDKISLKFKLSQEVYLALFQVSPSRSFVWPWFIVA